MTRADPGPLLTRTSDIQDVAEAIRQQGTCAFDLEFVSESRYVPVLGLVQVAWGDPESPEVAAADPLAAEVEPLVELVAAPEVEVAIHAAQGDLSLLADRFGVEGRAVVDTQVAAAFLGLGDQVGYTALVEETVGVELDKGAQFTDWLRRPLSERQLRYALDDARHLLPAWNELAWRLEARGRLEWVRQESERLAREAAERPEPKQMYQRIGGWQRLDPRQLGALRALAAWREEEALASNTPPSWLLTNRAVLELARRPPKGRKDLARTKGVKGDTARQHGREILEVLARGAEEPLEARRPPAKLSGEDKSRAKAISQLIRERCREVDVAPRFVGTRADAEALVRWWTNGDRQDEPDLPLLSGWRRELVGEEALAALRYDSPSNLDG